MQVTAQQIFRELDDHKWKPFYLVVGDESFQAGEISSRLKRFFIRDENSSTFNYEAWDGEHLDAAGLRASLETLPGLFDDPEGSVRLVSCSRFDKVSAAALEVLEDCFKDPSPTTCFLIFAAKVDKRKSWYKALDERGYVIEVSEPYEREWPKWQGYFERKVKKKVEAAAWERIIEGANHSLALTWADLQKMALYVGEKTIIGLEDWAGFASGGGGKADIFQFAENVLCHRAFESMQSYQRLLREGESEIKLISILVRQFRMVDTAISLAKAGITDNKTLASRIGTHPFFVPKVLAQSKHQNPRKLGRAIELLADCDLKMKTGQGTLFEHFLVPYFASPSLS